MTLRRTLWKTRLAAEILLVYVRVRREMRRDDIRVVAETLRTQEPPPRAVHDLSTARRLGRAVHLVLSVAPPRSRCLVQSLVLTRMLARRGIESSLVIGVTSDSGFAAHAWVEADGTPLLPPLAPTYVPLVRV